MKEPDEALEMDVEGNFFKLDEVLWQFVGSW
jgi:hypothetical protein